MAKLRVDKIASVGVSTETTGSVFFDGTNDTLTIADSNDFNFGSGDYTIEMWVYPERISGTQENLITRGTSGFSGFIMSVTNFLDTTNGSSWTVDITYTNPLVADKWQHIAVCRNGDTWTVYIDGVANGTTTVSGSVQASAQTLTIGERVGQTDFQGYISNLRICKGHAVYTSDFAPPTRELEVHPETVLLACYDGENIFADKSGRHIISANGDRTSSPTPTATDSPIGITTFSPGLIRSVDNTFGPTFQGGAGYNSQNWLTLPKGTTTDKNRTGGRGLFASGSDGASTNSIEYVQISTQGNALDFGDLTVSRVGAAGGVSNNTRGVFGGGDLVPGDDSDTIDYVNIASTGNAVSFGSLSSTRRFTAGCSNNTRGVFAGGYDPAFTNVIDFITIATLGSTSNFGDSTRTVGTYFYQGLSSSTRGLFGGGYAGATPQVAGIDFITIATTGNTQSFGDLTEARHAGAATSSSTRGIFVGGRNGSTLQNIMDYVTIATTGNATDFGDLITARRLLNASSNSIRGVFAGGYNPDLNTIDFVTIATTGNAADFGDLISALRAVSGCSDSHGGIS